MTTRKNSRTPLVIAHRGASGQTGVQAIENTLDAFARARSLGADGVELDIHETRDGRFVVHRDPDTPLGAISLLDLSDLRGRPGTPGGQVPSLEDVLQEMAGADPGAHVFVEIKTMSSWQNLQAELAPWRDRLRIQVQSFSLSILREIVQAPAGFDLAIIARDPIPAVVILLDSLDAHALSLHHAAVTADLVARLHGAGKQLYAWTVNEPERARSLAEMGVDALISDVPDSIIASLGQST